MTLKWWDLKCDRTLSAWLSWLRITPNEPSDKQTVFRKIVLMDGKKTDEIKRLVRQTFCAPRFHTRFDAFVFDDLFVQTLCPSTLFVAYNAAESQ